MNNYTLISIISLIIFSLSCKNRDISSSQSNQKITPEKELYIPAVVETVPDSNDYENPESDYSYSRMLETENFALFWHKEYGDNPMNNPDTTRRFNPSRAISECERFFNYYVNELKIVQKGNSITDKYKMLIYIYGGDGGTAFGGGVEGKIGILWSPAVRINKKPFGALAHELAHSFQYLSSFDCGTGPHGPIMEMSAQYMLWHVYPEWMTFENYHLVDYLKGTHYAFMHPMNMYHSPYILEYWSEKHGKDFYGKLCCNTQEGEDVVTTYKRLNSITQAQFNDEMFEAARRFITWDLDRVEEVASIYANQHKTTLHKIEDGWYAVDSLNCPQNYGYNGIKLNIPAEGTNIILNFKGIVAENGYNKVKTDKAGWRYGFLASLKNGNRVYGEINTEGTAQFKVPKNTEHLWLVVSGAPTEHWPIEFKWGQKNDSPDEQWPYKIKLEGTTVDDSCFQT